MEKLAFGPNGWGDEMLLAMLMTLAVSVCSLLLGTVIGTLLAWVKLSGPRVLRWLANGYTTLIRGVPELLIIYLLFFGGNGAVMFVASIFGHEGYIEVPAFAIGVVAVGLISGAYSTEVIRGAVQAVSKGQLEAAHAIGMPRMTLFSRVLVPQTARLALPGMGNVWQLTLKDTALISVTGLVELMRQAYVASGSERSPFLFYSTAAVLFLVLTSLSERGFVRAERWANRGASRT